MEERRRRRWDETVGGSREEGEGPRLADLEELEGELMRTPWERKMILIGRGRGEDEKEEEERTTMMTRRGE